MVRRFLSLPAPQQGPVQGAGRGRRVLPFAALSGGVFATFLVTNATALTAIEVVGLGAAVGLLALAWWLCPWDILPRTAQNLLPLGVLGVVVAMQVVARPNDVDLAALMVVPVLWSAAYGTARDAVVVTGAAIASVTVLQAVGMILGSTVGLTGWTEVLALSGALLLMSGITVTARAHARTDPLTGAANRRAWDDILSIEIDRARRHPVPVSVAIIDLDEFKRFNDSHGHAAGDRHLAACVSAWRGCLRAHDVLARLGGEEFAVLLVGADGGAEEVAERLIGAVPGAESCSIGLARWDGAEAPASLMARADDALYRAKATGRGRVATAPPRRLVALAA